VLHLASKRGRTQIVEEVFKQCKEKLRVEDLKNKMLLAKAYVIKAAWHVAAYLNNIEILQKI